VPWPSELCRELQAHSWQLTDARVQLTDSRSPLLLVTDMLREYFQQYGGIMDAVVMKARQGARHQRACKPRPRWLSVCVPTERFGLVLQDRATNKPRGFGFVTFDTLEASQRAVAQRHTINGRVVSGAC
jgi:hypothetical protein